MLRQEDKRKHMVWSFVLVVASLSLLPIWIATLLVFFLGLAKEVWDEYFGSGFCVYDILSNCFGISLGLLTVWPLQRMLSI